MSNQQSAIRCEQSAISNQLHRSKLQAESSELKAESLKLKAQSSRLKAFLAMALIIASCSPKTAPVPRKPAPKPPVATTPAPKPVETAPEPVKRRVNTLALILPFQLDKITTKTVQGRDVNRAEIALDFYQGFKYALDSLAQKGFDFRIQLLDSRDNNNQVIALARSAAVQQSDVVIGPILPDGIKVFGTSADLRNKLQVSPLAAAMPSQFHNPRLVTLMNSIDQHAKKMVDFIGSKYTPNNLNIVLSNARSAADEQFAAPLRKYISSAKTKFTVTEITGLNGIESKLARGKTNVVIMTSARRDFVNSSINVLDKLREAGYAIELYGHPNWSKIDNLDAEKLQGLNARFTSSYYVDYESPEVKRFVAGYSARYKMPPADYAINGFDTGYLFGSLLAKYGPDYVKNLNKAAFKGIHTDFSFSFDPSSGYLNNTVMMMRFGDFEIKPEE